MLNLELLRADASYKGRVQFAQATSGPALQLAGDVVVEDFRALSRVGGAVEASNPATGSLEAPELLSWNALSLRGLQVALTPGTATTVQVSETVVTDFFARVILNEEGRLNLADLVRTAPAASTTASVASLATTDSIAASAVNTRASDTFDLKTTAVTAPTTGPAAIINIGPISLLNGRVFFSDRFIKPNYSANLSALNGKLSAFSSVAPQGSPQLADLELLGRAEGTAALSIRGQLNPLAQPLALNITANMTDLELPPLSTYSIKFAGHGIERGKLTMSVTYIVQPNGQLEARNRLVLNQLRFGDKVDGAPASLPVKLAVALLADRNGVIDLDLPLSGSLNDPQFRMGPIIWKIIVNLVTKAITAPFSLLASAFGGGGGDELSNVAFVPGTDGLTPQAKQGLDKVAKALNDRPALKLTVVGEASLPAEREAFRRERLSQLLLAEQRRNVVTGAATTSPSNTSTTTVTISPDDYPALLKAVYRRADITKPRNALGLTKDIPQGEMQALLLASIPATDDLMRELAVQRGLAVKAYLISQQLPAERLFLGASKLPEPDAKWTPRAELKLDAQ